MSKKKFLELLIQSYGLTPVDVKFYHTDSCGGQFQNGIGWQGEGVSKDGKTMISFEMPDGFNMAVKEILEQAKKLNLTPVYIY